MTGTLPEFLAGPFDGVSFNVKTGNVTGMNAPTRVNVLNDNEVLVWSRRMGQHYYWLCDEGHWHYGGEA